MANVSSTDEIVLEVDRDDLTPAYVRRRVKDWQRRVDRVIRDIRKWAKSAGATVKDGEPVTMNEAPMRKAGVAAETLPSLHIEFSNGGIIRVIPAALWVLGANGVIDLFTNRGLFELFDFADPPFAPPVWRIHGPKRKGVDLNRENFLGLLNGHE